MANHSLMDGVHSAFLMDMPYVPQYIESAIQNHKHANSVHSQVCFGVIITLRIKTLLIQNAERLTSSNPPLIRLIPHTLFLYL